ncbi:MAG: DNA mismatch repair protein MutS [Deltaproteobacteria bacterium]|nr:MAG: DNA mismatch repair protein MutS [Deltaproteobacteria bacterium]
MGERQRDSSAFRPFEAFRDQLLSRSYPSKPTYYRPSVPPASGLVQTATDDDRATDAALFAEAMDGVAPLSGTRRIVPPLCRVRKSAAQDTAIEADTAAFSQLRELVATGRGFRVWQTPEYMCGSADSAHPELCFRLHRGDFPVQGHLDLHGLTVDEARPVFLQFLKESIRSGKRNVLVIHGRGLSSPREPVLKSRIYAWLSSRALRKWVLAFSSARMCDGGAGGTYVLLNVFP